MTSHVLSVSTACTDTAIPRTLTARTPCAAFVFRLDDAVLSWHSKLHSYVTSCTNHSEYALFIAAKEAQWLVYLFQDFKLAAELLTPIPIYVDSSGVVSMFNPVDHQSNKHVKNSRELTELRVIAPQRLPSADNVADAFTISLWLHLHSTQSCPSL